MPQGSEHGIVIEFRGDGVVTGAEQSEDDGVQTGRAAWRQEDGLGAGCVEELGECSAGAEEE